MPPHRDTPLTRRTTVLTGVLACLATGLLGGLGTASAAPTSPRDPASIESQLFSQLQQDRYQHGLGGFVINGTLAAYARSLPYQPCPGVIAHGRSQDMVERNYFSHYVPPCGVQVLNSIQASGLPMQAWGENIAWTTTSGAGIAPIVNATFMASPPHRANILGPYNSVGVGAWTATGPWTGGGGALGGVTVVTVLFARLGGVTVPWAPRAPYVPPRPRAPAPPAAAPAPPPAPTPPSPDPIPIVLDYPSGRHKEIHVIQRPLKVSAVHPAATGPAFLGWFGILMLVAVGPPAALVSAIRDRRGTPYS